MSFFDKLKQLFIGKKDATSGKSGVLSFSSGIRATDGAKEFNATYCNCADTLARHISKIDIEVFNNNTDCTKFKYLERILQFQPNTIQNACNLWHTLAYDYFFSGFGLAYIEWDYSNILQTKVKHIWPISSKNIKSIRIYNRKVYFQFVLDGKTCADSIDNFIVLVRNPRSDSAFNTNNENLSKIMNILATNDQGVIKAIENSNRIQFIVSSVSNMNDKMIKDNQEKFNQRLSDAENVLYATNAEHIQQVNNQSKYATPEEVKCWKKEIYHSFGVNEKLLDSSFDEDDWQSLFEGAMEPFVKLLTQELTIKILSEREFDVGNRFRVVSNPLLTASMGTRIKIAEVYEKLPTIKPNVVCDILYLPRLENGDKEVQSLNFVNANKADSYQDVGGKSEDPKDDSDSNK